MRNIEKNKRLALFFTKKTSLGTWARVGNLDRETALYKKLSEYLKEVSFITYGGKEDKKFSDKLDNIKLMPIKWHKRQTLTILELMLKHYPELRKTNILKTNQMPGAEIPIWFKNRFGKRLIVRCGYLHSYCTKRKTKDSRTIEEAVLLEKKAFSAADMIILSARWEKEMVVRNYNIDPAKVKIIPNYVLTDIFKPYKGFEKKFDLIYLGRSDEGKNLKSLLEALNLLNRKNKNLSLLLIGGGYRDKNLRDLAIKYKLNVIFKDNIPNFQLPLFLNKSRIFIFPSMYEGHPKALIEAMSCGLPCIGCNVTGVNEVINHMETGFLCEPDYKGIASAVDLVTTDKSLRKKMGTNARKYVLNNYSFDKILKKELDVIREVIEK